MTSPIELNTTTFYEVEDYGSGMTPFYTNLALWVGGMVLIALLKQEVDEDEKVKKFTLNQAYFGGTVPDYLSGRSVSFKGTVCPSGTLYPDGSHSGSYLSESDLRHYGGI